MNIGYDDVQQAQAPDLLDEEPPVQQVQQVQEVQEVQQEVREEVKGHQELSPVVQPVKTVVQHTETPAKTLPRPSPVKSVVKTQQPQPLVHHQVSKVSLILILI